MRESEYLKWSSLKKERGKDRHYYLYPISGVVGNVNGSYANYYPSTMLFTMFMNANSEGETDIKYTRSKWMKELKSLLGFEGGFILIVERMSSVKGKCGIHVEFYTTLEFRPSEEDMIKLRELFSKPVPMYETHFDAVDEIKKLRKEKISVNEDDLFDF